MNKKAQHDSEFCDIVENTGHIFVGNDKAVKILL